MARSTQTYRIKLDTPEGGFEGELQIPQGAMRLAELAYAVLGISSAAAESVELGAAKFNYKVSCKKGCGACCRQLVPISPAEALYLGELVQSLPEPRQGEVRRRFAEIEGKTRAAELWEDLLELDDPALSEAGHAEISRRYFHLGMPCPFLEEESCSIHHLRPSICREYAVVSPAENCSDPFTKPINQLPMSLRMSDALARVSAEALEEPPQLIPLSLALWWFAENKEHQWKGWDAAALVDRLMHHLKRAISGRPKPAKG